MVMEFFMPMKPPTVTHQEKSVRIVNNKPIFYEPANLEDARAKLKAHLATYTPATPYVGGVRLTTRWLFPVVRNTHNGQYRTTKPDTDNLQKLLKDVMTDLGYWTDDALVASELIEKFWSDIPGIFIRIEPLDGT